MDALVNVFGSIPWYGWVAIVAIVCGTIVKVSANRNRAA